MNYAHENVGQTVNSWYLNKIPGYGCITVTNRNVNKKVYNTSLNENL